MSTICIINRWRSKWTAMHFDVCIFIYVCICIYMYSWCMYIYMYSLYMYNFMHIYMHIWCMYIYIWCMYIYTYIFDICIFLPEKDLIEFFFCSPVYVNLLLKKVYKICISNIYKIEYIFLVLQYMWIFYSTSIYVIYTKYILNICTCIYIHI